MARTTVAGSKSDLQRLNMHGEKLFRDILSATTFKPLSAGADEASFVSIQTPNLSSMTMTPLTHSKGTGAYDRFYLTLALSNDPIKNGASDIAVGSEEALSTDVYEHEIDMYEKDVHGGTVLSHLRSFVDLKKEARTGLSNFIVDWNDQLFFDSLNKDVTPTGFVHLNTSDVVTTTTSEPSTSSITAATLISPEFLAHVSEIAATGDSVLDNLKSFRMKKIPVNGKPSFVLLVPPRVATNLKIDPTFAQYVREVSALKADPIFRRAVALVDDILIIESEKVAVDSTNKVAKCTLLGENGVVVSLARVDGTGVDIQELTKNAGRDDILVARWFLKISRPDFKNSAGTAKDYGSLAVYIRYA